MSRHRSVRDGPIEREDAVERVSSVAVHLGHFTLERFLNQDVKLVFLHWQSWRPREPNTVPGLTSLWLEGVIQQGLATDED